MYASSASAEEEEAGAAASASSTIAMSTSKRGREGQFRVPLLSPTDAIDLSEISATPSTNSSGSSSSDMGTEAPTPKRDTAGAGAGGAWAGEHYTWTPKPRLAQAANNVGMIGAGLMLLAYLLSCLGAYPALNPVCYDGTRIYFWGGFGDEVPCAGVPTYAGGWAVALPFYYPDTATNVVTMWTMTQRAGSVTYHIFTA